MAKPKNKTAEINAIVTPAIIPSFLDAGMVETAAILPEGGKVGAFVESLIFDALEDMALTLTEVTPEGEDDGQVVGLDASTAPLGRSGAK